MASDRDKDDDPNAPSRPAGIDRTALGVLLMRMFDFSPIPISISTIEPARYVQVNAAYLELTGFTWADIAGADMTRCGAAIDSPERQRRRRLLDTQGFYRVEEVTIRRKDGREIPTLISAQRSTIDGVAYDVEMLIDVSDRVALQAARERELSAAALTDGLTGLANRIGFDRHLAEALAGAGPERATLLVFIDLNGFKQINDSQGHAAGDEVLRAVARRLAGQCRDGDCAARIGGDEFALVMRRVPEEREAVRQALDRMAAAVFTPVALSGRGTKDAAIEVGGAIGVGLTVTAATGTDEVLALADRQMYLAKATGARLAVRIAAIEDPPGT